jgi:CDP-glucose 4,6-dehydratase
MTRSFSAFKGARVLVTGDTGFKGSWLSLWLSELGASVTGLALAAEEHSHFRQLQLQKIINHVDGDIRDLQQVRDAFKQSKPQIVFHLAAQPLVQRSYAEPKLTFDTNVGGSVNVLEAARDCSTLQSMIFVTSDKCYRNKNWVWGYRETDELGGSDPYSASKAAAELAFRSYLESFLARRTSLGAASVRAGNVIGGGDYAENRIVPDCIRALTAGELIVIRNPQSTRPWQHVLDPLRGYLKLSLALLDKPNEFSGAWNFGPSDLSVKTVDEVAKEIIRNWGSGKISYSPASDDHPEARLLHLNCDKAHSLLNWRPHWDFTESISRTVEWYQKTRTGKDAVETSRQQISAHMEGCHD